MKTITLYTGEYGFNLFKNGLAFLASEDKQGEHDYKVTAPINNILEYPLADDLGCHDVFRLDGVTVNQIKKEDKECTF